MNDGEETKHHDRDHAPKFLLHKNHSMKRFLGVSTDPIELPAVNGLRETVHVFDEDSVLAVNAALAANRPLLVRGEPGVGKTQLARAVAAALERNFYSVVIDAQMESRDLLWQLDAVSRLGMAQILGSLGVRKDAQEDRETKVLEELSEKRFLLPGALWWAFHWEEAARQWRKVRRMESDPASPQGTVVLIDEIDKADSSVPNGLLEALGHGRFPIPGGGEVVATGPDPLVIISTNEERSLPDAFLRRCLVHHLSLPKDPPKLQDWLMDRGRAHFAWNNAQDSTAVAPVSDPVLQKAAEMLIEDRSRMHDAGLSAPGQAEYLDLLRAVVEISFSPDQKATVSRRKKPSVEELEETQLKLLERLSGFTYRKHPPEDYS